MMYDVTAIGELLIDMTPHNIGGTAGFLPNPGGAPANVAVAVSKLGGISAFIGKVGNDNFGHFLKRTLVDEKVDTMGLMIDKNAPTTLAFVHLDEKGERSFSFYRKHCADTQLSIDDLNLSIIEQCRILCFGSVALADYPIRETVLYAVQHAKKNDIIICFDVNYRPFLWDDEAAAVAAINSSLALADIVKMSREEMELITGRSDLSEGTATIAKLGAKIVIVTLGIDGAYLRYRDSINLVTAPVVKAIDTNGAGDAFLGGLLYQLSRRKDVFALSHHEMEHAVGYANAVGALTTTKSGAIPALPTQDEICSYIKSCSI